MSLLGQGIAGRDINVFNHVTNFVPPADTGASRIVLIFALAVILSVGSSSWHGFSEKDYRQSLLLEREMRTSALQQGPLEAETPLTAELQAIEADIANEGAYARTLEQLNELKLSLNDFASLFPRAQIARAQSALDRGDRAPAEVLLAAAQTQTRTANQIEAYAEATFLRGSIAEQEFRWRDAVAYYSEAARSSPSFSRLYRAGELSFLIGEYQIAESFLSDAITYGRESEVGFGSIVNVLQVQIQLYIAIGQNRQAQYIAYLLISLIRSSGDDLTTQLAIAHSRLSVSLRNSGQLDLALSEARVAVELGRGVFSDDDPELALILSSLAAVYRANRRLELAQEVYHEAHAILQSALPDSHPYVAQSLNNMGLLHLNLQEFELAIHYLERSLTVRRETLGNLHPLTGETLNNLGLSFRAIGRFDEAAEALREAILIAESRLETDQHLIAIRLSNLASVLRQMGRYEDAEPILRRSLSIALDLVADGQISVSHPSIATRSLQLAEVLIELGRFIEAEEHLSVALEVRKQLFLSSDYSPGRMALVLSVFDRFVDLRLAEENVDGAVEVYVNAVRYVSQFFPDSHPILRGLARDAIVLIRDRQPDARYLVTLESRFGAYR